MRNDIKKILRCAIASFYLHKLFISTFLFIFGVTIITVLWSMTSNGETRGKPGPRAIPNHQSPAVHPTVSASLKCTAFLGTFFHVNDNSNNSLLFPDCFCECFLMPAAICRHPSLLHGSSKYGWSGGVCPPHFTTCPAAIHMPIFGNRKQVVGKYAPFKFSPAFGPAALRGSWSHVNTLLRLVCALKYA